jgi:hypothetical protein
MLPGAPVRLLRRIGLNKKKKAFPEIAEEINKGDDESGGTNTNSSQ